MEAKQNHLEAKFTAKKDNGKNLYNQKELLDTNTIVDKKTEKVIVDCRIYGGRSKNSSTIYASIWVYNIKENKIPEAERENWQYQYNGTKNAWFSGQTSGHGKAGGYGYHKASEAVQNAIDSAGIELYGTPYAARGEKVDFKTRTCISGTGDVVIYDSLLAIAYAAGYNDVILV